MKLAFHILFITVVQLLSAMPALGTNLEFVRDVLGRRETMLRPHEPPQRDLPAAPIRALDVEHVHPAAEAAAQPLRPGQTSTGRDAFNEGRERIRCRSEVRLWQIQAGFE